MRLTKERLEEIRKINKNVPHDLEVALLGHIEVLEEVIVQLNKDWHDARTARRAFLERKTELVESQLSESLAAQAGMRAALDKCKNGNETYDGCNWCDDALRGSSNGKEQLDSVKELINQLNKKEHYVDDDYIDDVIKSFHLDSGEK